MVIASREKTVFKKSEASWVSRLCLMVVLMNESHEPFCGSNKSCGDSVIRLIIFCGEYRLLSRIILSNSPGLRAAALANTKLEKQKPMPKVFSYGCFDLKCLMTASRSFSSDTPRVVLLRLIFGMRVQSINGVIRSIVSRSCWSGCTGHWVVSSSFGCS